MTQQPISDRFIQDLTSCQQSLYAFVLSLVHDLEAAQDILQETNLVLWRKAGEYNPEVRFIAWAIEVARFQTLAYLRDRGRDRHMYSPELLNQLAEEAAERLPAIDLRRKALRECLQTLPESQRDLTMRRYAENLSNRDLALAAGTSVTAMSQSLYRIRKALIDCIQNKLGVDEK